MNLAINVNLATNVYESETTQVDEVYEDEESLTLEKTNNLVYLEQCIKETLRIHPPAQATLRVNWNEDVTVDDLFIPKG